MDDFIEEIFKELTNKTFNNPDLTNPKHFSMVSEILYRKNLSPEWISKYMSNLSDYIKGGKPS